MDLTNGKRLLSNERPRLHEVCQLLLEFLWPPVEVLVAGTEPEGIRPPGGPWTQEARS